MALAHVLGVGGVTTVAENLGRADPFVGRHRHLLLDVPPLGFPEAFCLVNHPLHTPIVPEIAIKCKPRDAVIR